MDNKQKNQEFVMFDARPTGEAVNPYVFQIAPQREPDYATLHRLIKEAGQPTSVEKPED